jgi:hypothetical protein
MQTRRAVFGLETGIDTTQIARLSRMVANYTGIPVSPNKAIVGANAFAHEAGIHQDGMLKNKTTYEIMLPETVGLNRSQLVLGKHSGPCLRVRLSSWQDLSTEEKFNLCFKQLADKKKDHRCRPKSGRPARKWTSCTGWRLGSAAPRAPLPPRLRDPGVEHAGWRWHGARGASTAIDVVVG